MARVDVFIPTYERPKWTVEAVASVLRQTVSDLTLTVSDDSRSNSVESAVARFAADARFSYIRHVPRNGMSGNWNDCIRRSNSEYIHIFHDDDILVETMLEKVLTVLDNRPDVSFVHTAGWRINEEGLIVDRPSSVWPDVTDGKSFSRMLLSCSENTRVICPSVVMRKRSLEYSGLFRETSAYGWDHELWVRLAEQGNVAFISEPLIKNRMRTGKYSLANWDWLIEATEMSLELERRRVMIFGSSVVDRATSEVRYFVQRDVIPLRTIAFLAAQGEHVGAQEASRKFKGEMSGAAFFLAQWIAHHPMFTQSVSDAVRPLRKWRRNVRRNMR